MTEQTTEQATEQTTTTEPGAALAAPVLQLGALMVRLSHWKGAEVDAEGVATDYCLQARDARHHYPRARNAGDALAVLNIPADGLEIDGNTGGLWARVRVPVNAFTGSAVAICLRRSTDARTARRAVRVEAAAAGAFFDAADDSVNVEAVDAAAALAGGSTPAEG